MDTKLPATSPEYTEAANAARAADDKATKSGAANDYSRAAAAHFQAKKAAEKANMPTFVKKHADMMAINQAKFEKAQSKSVADEKKTAEGPKQFASMNKAISSISKAGAKAMPALKKWATK